MVSIVLPFLLLSGQPESFVNVNFSKTTRSGETQSLTIDFKGNQQGARQFWESDAVKSMIDKVAGNNASSLNVTFTGEGNRCFIHN